MQTKRVIVIGTSASGIDALRTIVGGLPADFDAAIAVVVHTSPQSPGVLPDHHMLLEPGRIRGPRENRFRPAVDPLFRSAAQVYSPLVVGVVLTGNLDDGTAGLWAIKQLGGTAIVQDPDDALYPGEPVEAAHSEDRHRHRGGDGRG